MRELSEKQLRNLNTDQLDEISRELGHSIKALDVEVSLLGSKADYTRKRSFEKYLTLVKAVLRHKRNTKQK